MTLLGEIGKISPISCEVVGGGTSRYSSVVAALA